jgi:hypothetical protein
MQWWNDFVTWFNSAAGTRVITTAILPFLAIVVAGVLAAIIARSSAKRVLAHQDREIKAAAIMALIGAGRRAAVWSSLGADEKQHVDALISESDLRMRLLPVSGAIAAADWATHELGAMKKNSSNFSFQAEQTFFDYRDRLLDWQLKPAKAKKLFAFDLVQWQYEDGDKSQSAVVSQQQQWAAEHVQPPTNATAVIPPVAPDAAPAPAPNASTTPASPVVPATAPVVAAPAVAAEPAASEGSESSTAAPKSFLDPEPDEDDSPELVVPAGSTGPVTTAPVTRVPTSDDSDDDAVDESESAYAPPVNAGAVRARTAPEQSLDS